MVAGPNKEGASPAHARLAGHALLHMHSHMTLTRLLGARAGCMDSPAHARLADRLTGTNLPNTLWDFISTHTLTKRVALLQKCLLIAPLLGHTVFGLAPLPLLSGRLGSHPHMAVRSLRARAPLAHPHSGRLRGRH